MIFSSVTRIKCFRNGLVGFLGFFIRVVDGWLTHNASVKIDDAWSRTPDPWICLPLCHRQRGLGVAHRMRLRTVMVQCLRSN